MTASRRASAIERRNSSPVSAVRLSTSSFASPERRRIVELIARSLRPFQRERDGAHDSRPADQPNELAPLAREHSDTTGH